ncbi:Uncharacterised protein [Enterococcus faecium]|nr:Uncharacterised protein [Enterococcus faecium]
MQTVIGSNGQIGYELAKELNQTYGKQLRLVSRNPKSIDDTDELISADILDRVATIRAVAEVRLFILLQDYRWTPNSGKQNLKSC